MPSRRVTAIASGAVVAVLGALHLKRKRSKSSDEPLEMSTNGSSPSDLIPDRESAEQYQL